MPDCIELENIVIENKSKSKSKISKMKRYVVVLHNDDRTPMDFVIMILMQTFNKTMKDAFDITMQVHDNGRGLAGTYPKEIAKSKVEEVHKLAEHNGFPLTLSIEEE